MHRLVLVVLLVCWFIAAQEAQAQGHPSSARASGRALFQQHCASCHGDDGKGAGPAAVAFKVQPPDLTELSRQNHGRFPKDRVVQAIRGNRTESAHGSTDMPVWGPVFRAMTGVNEVEVESRIRDLTEHLKSMQLK
jgi:mono/diheme cytochrome c family protein